MAALRRSHGLLVPLGVLLASVVVGCSPSDEIAAETEWVEFGVDGQFTAQFPEEPSPQSQDVSELENVVAITIFAVQDGIRELGISVTELATAVPDDVANSLLPGAVDAFAVGVNGSVVDRGTVNGAPYPTMDATINGTKDGQAIVAMLRTTFVGTLQFNLVSLGLEDDRNEVEARFDRLIDGFEPEVA
ncbi:MAG: hypothetical protein ACRD29_09960 [Acidimicrobiales bacterium]